MTDIISLNIGHSVVPFGKYRDRPVAELAADRQYCDWLAAQPWFRERYADLYQVVIVNAAAPPEDTPEHNKLQARFLDIDYCKALLLTVCGKMLSDQCEYEFGLPYRELKKRIADAEETVKRYSGNPNPTKWQAEYLAEAQTKLAAALAQKVEPPQFTKALLWSWLKPTAGFECPSGFDVVIESRRGFWFKLFVEVKPSIGDDYPSVLRQIRAQQRRAGHSCEYACLVYERFAADGATEQQMRSIFGSVATARFDEIDATLAAIEKAAAE